MSIFREDFLNRVKSRGAPAKPKESATQLENGGAQTPDTLEELVKQAKAAGRTGPLVVGPPRSSLKSSWREETKALEQQFPEEFATAANTAGAACRRPERELASPLVTSSPARGAIAKDDATNGA